MPSQGKNTTSTQRSSTMLNLIVSSSWQNVQLLLLFSLTLLYLANSAPLEETSPRRRLSQEWEEARQIWNGVRSVKKQLVERGLSRMRRSSSDLPANTYGLDNVSVPAYVKELYRNISQLDAEDIDATTIRSLPAINSGENGK